MKTCPSAGWHKPAWVEIEKSWRTQARVPAGSPKGGEWTASGGGGFVPLAGVTNLTREQRFHDAGQELPSSKPRVQEIASSSPPVAQLGDFKTNKKLNNQEAMALNVYTTTLHENINDKLRRDQPLTDLYEPDVKRLDGLANKFALDKDAVVYRGAFSKMFDNMSTGDVFQDKGYVSTSTDAKMAKGFANLVNRRWKGVERGGVIEVRLPKGQKAIPVNFVLGSKHYKADELEILLPRGQKFRYEGKRKDPRTKIEVFVVTAI